MWRDLDGSGRRHRLAGVRSEPHSLVTSDLRPDLPLACIVAGIVEARTCGRSPVEFAPGNAAQEAEQVGRLRLAFNLAVDGAEWGS